MNIKDFLKLLKLCWNRSGAKINLLIIITSITTVLELVGFGLVIPLINLSFTSENIDDSKVSQIFDNLLQTFGLSLEFNLVLLMIVIIFFFKGFFVFLGNNLQIWITTGIRKTIQNKIIGLYEDVDYRFFMTKKIGDHTNLLIRECEGYQTVINNISKGFVAFTSALLFVVSLSIVDLYFIIFLVFFSGLVFLVFIPIIKKTKFFSFSNVKLYSLLNAQLIELIQNFSYLKGTFRTGIFTKTIYRITEKLVNINRRLGVFSNLIGSIKEPLGVLIISGLIFIKVTIFNSSLPEVIVLGLILYRLIQKILDIQNHWQRLNESVASVFCTEDEIINLNNKQEIDGDLKILNLQKRISFKKVSFSYDKKQILKNINLEIKPKNTTGIRGKSGIGKTTLVKLIMKLIKPSQGVILCGNKNIKNIQSQSLRSKIGYVSQDINLFNGSLKENITFWDTKENYEEIKKSMKLAGCFDLYERLEENIGDKAMKLSGGQKQRVLIAREIYKKPDILIFDEPTSSLDSKSEDIIIKTIKTLKKKITIIIVSHRKKLFKICDKIIDL